MPFYRCAVPKDAVPFEARQAVARAFTDVHCGATNAPRSFVHVVFDEHDDTDWGVPYFIDGGNRAGRPQSKKDELLEGLQAAFSHHTGISRDQMMARHKANHIQVAYAESAQAANNALAVKIAMMQALGVKVHLCGTNNGLVD